MNLHRREKGLLFFVASVFLVGCASTTLIKSSPSGATVYVDEQEVGTTPHRYTDEDIIFTEHRIKLEKEGYKDLNTIITRDEELDTMAAIGGLFFWPCWLWALKYHPVHEYTLKPLHDSFQVSSATIDTTRIEQKPATRYERLMALHGLLTDGALSNEEFSEMKTKILNEPHDTSRDKIILIKELKRLSDKGVLTVEEFNQEKREILEAE